MAKHGFLCFVLLVGNFWCLPAPAACVVNDADFSTADGGCKDLDTGLVWSSDMRSFVVTQSGFYASSTLQAPCNEFLNQKPENGGGFTDWRGPTLQEVQTALANGLNSHLDFFNDGGATPDDGRYRWTACMQRVKGRWKEYAIRFTDGNVALESLAAFPVICVRGKPANPEADCPGKKNSKSHAFSQATAGAVLLLPLAVVLAARCLRPRQQ